MIPKSSRDIEVTQGIREGDHEKDGGGGGEEHDANYEGDVGLLEGGVCEEASDAYDSVEKREIAERDIATAEAGENLTSGICRL